MKTGRVQAFSDGVFAIIITIMVLELQAPEGHGWGDLLEIWPKLIGYVVSFVYIGIYWNNHHHIFQVARTVSGSALWANLAMLFVLSLFPLGTAWVGDTKFAPAPMSFYALIALGAGATYSLLVHRLIRGDRANERLAKATGAALKEKLSIGGYAVGALAPLAGHAGAMVSAALMVLIAAMWVVPDRRIERVMREIPGVDDGDD